MYSPHKQWTYEDIFNHIRKADAVVVVSFNALEHTSLLDTLEAGGDAAEGLPVRSCVALAFRAPGGGVMASEEANNTLAINGYAVLHDWVARHVKDDNT